MSIWSSLKFSLYAHFPLSLVGSEILEQVQLLLARFPHPLLCVSLYSSMACNCLKVAASSVSINSSRLTSSCSASFLLAFAISCKHFPLSCCDGSGQLCQKSVTIVINSYKCMHACMYVCTYVCMHSVSYLLSFLYALIVKLLNGKNR